MIKTFLFPFLLLLTMLTFRASSQSLTPEELAEAHVYTSLQEALDNPEKVYKLSLRKQKIAAIPAEIAQLKNLQWLDLSRNKLSDFPEAVCSIPSLEYLNLSRNKIEMIPKNIGEMKNLKELHLQKNKLMYLPAQIGGLSSLEILDLWNNAVSFFPEELKELHNLRKMDLREIEINDEEQKRISELLPHVKILFSPSCLCKY
jgi:Leucine-rich repeat (LRR) protein